jgi:hypothetical protein
VREGGVIETGSEPAAGGSVLPPRQALAELDFVAFRLFIDYGIWFVSYLEQLLLVLVSYLFDFSSARGKASTTSVLQAGKRNTSRPSIQITTSSPAEWACTIRRNPVSVSSMAALSRTMKSNPGSRGKGVEDGFD